jgi:hypothetical protein
MVISALGPLRRNAIGCLLTGDNGGPNVVSLTGTGLVGGDWCWGSCASGYRCGIMSATGQVGGGLCRV